MAARLHAAYLEIADLKSAVAELQRQLQTLSRKEARARHLAYYDELTGLPNRSLLRDRLHQALAQAKRSGKRLALLFIDLNNFKDVNDGFGHRQGDRLLQAVAARLRRCTREGDTVCRYGGDEFVVLLPDIASEQLAADISATIEARLAQPYLLDSQPIRISCCIGSAFYPTDATDAQTLMHAADTAMYRVKGGGRARHLRPLR